MIKYDKKPHILVIGDLMIDEYLWGSCDRISPEAPVQVVDIKKETKVLGGAGNVINNLVSLGAKVSVMSVIGNDESGQEVKSMLDQIEVKTFLVEQKNRKTSRKTRLMASNSQVVRYDKESKNDINFDSVKKLYSKLQEKINAYDTILLSDYAKGVLTDDLIRKVITFANKHNVKVLVDPKGSDFSKYSGAYLLTPNKKEAEFANKIKIENQNSLKDILLKQKANTNIDISLITLSENGIAFLKNNKAITKPTVSREVYDVTGAGDTVLAALGFAISLNYDIETAIEFANLAAGIVVGKIGNGLVTLEEIKEYETELNEASIESLIKNKKEIKKIATKIQIKNKKIVFTNGCFDILHKGHVKYLEKAKTFGDVLIVGVNSDKSVKKIKGQNRPINNEEDRAYILAGLKSVNYVVIFEEETPHDLIKSIKPNILVKGGDYKGKNVIGQELVKELKIVEFEKGKSTTKTIKKVIKSEKNN